MTDLEIHQPDTLDEALELLSRLGEDVKVIAGGTAMVLMLKTGLIAPESMVSLARIEGLDGIEHEQGDGLTIGALATLRDGEMSPLVRRVNPVLAKTLGTVANVRVRNAATLGGNLAEADYASDPPATLLAMRAVVVARSVRGEREIPLTDFFRDFYETALEPDEIITQVRVPELSETTRCAYLKYVTRSSEDRPCVGVSTVVEMAGDDDGTCQDLRVVVGAVAATPQEVPSAEALATGKRLDEELINDIAEAYGSAIDPLDDLRGSKWYRQRVISVFVRRSIETALRESREEPA
ncbi:MAG: 4-hydroxybenzoyl-CoA reductase [Acidimicrobiia bacterium]|nr:4-hydroxybenzoyl-CoA reductase [Acidimicrobiia bacterium]